MREIKFRAWNGVLHEYRTVDMNSGKQNLGMGFEATEGIGSNTTTIYHSVGDVIEQYTGIDDRVGNSVYENDIVEIEYTAGHHTILDQQTLGMVEQYSDVDTIVRGVVHIWPSTGAIINNISSENPEQFVGDYRIPQYLHINKDCIVIGNIHKNPELLEEK
ncbi:YopX family protein [Leuconostoc suionicum]|uniref:YopX family protein n=1 Tax=Leuconostoc suionicum TaxID=1511761 RepID=UPI0024ADB829|nr:YopX family protein [Leuconostoc suionicum]MDI6497911.1 YopX family protein [Leuconostoc suionicum]MDI6499992.1 YopX family protein [Leuconostoc suionicum]